MNLGKVDQQAIIRMTTPIISWPHDVSNFCDRAPRDFGRRWTASPMQRRFMGRSPKTEGRVEG